MKTKEEIFFNQNSCRFEIRQGSFIKNELPLSIILQVTRHCNFSCIFCSETEKMPDPSLSKLHKMRDNLLGVSRVYISGGEPLLRKDLLQVLELFYSDFVVGLPTNATTVTADIAKDLKNRLDFVNIGLDGPRNITTTIRGDYDKIMKGIYHLKYCDIPIALSCVILNSTKDSVLFTCQIADVLDAVKLKLIIPIPKGNALGLSENEYLNTEDANNLFADIKKAKKIYGWTPKITLTTWGAEVEGYSLLVYPNGNTYAWPVYNQIDKVLLLGNLADENIKDIWAKNPYKQNHYNKYLGKSILAA
ncbi:radical SAM protein [Candidatus Parcubacteria bacterium]|nr:radical SAM protein [Candidatus Parcubacteria bacterium]